MLFKTVIIIVSVLGLLSVFLYLNMPDGEQKVTEKLTKAGIEIEEMYTFFDDSMQIRSKIIGTQTKPKVVFIHGSPGDWSNWELVVMDLELREKFCLVLIDRAGFGKTTVPAQAELKVQAEVIWRVLEKWPEEQFIVVGHSYGGAVVEQLLVDHPDNFGKGVFVAPTLSPEFQQPRWYNSVADFGLVNWALPVMLQASNIEMMGLPEALLSIEQHLSTIETPIVYIQGKEDVLVPYQTMDYFSEKGPSQTEFIVKEDMDHFTPWSDPQLIIDAILE